MFTAQLRDRTCRAEGFNIRNYPLGNMVPTALIS